MLFSSSYVLVFWFPPQSVKCVFISSSHAHPFFLFPVLTNILPKMDILGSYFFYLHSYISYSILFSWYLLLHRTSEISTWPAYTYLIYLSCKFLMFFLSPRCDFINSSWKLMTIFALKLQINNTAFFNIMTIISARSA
jgi:hypothetical protein